MNGTVRLNEDVVEWRQVDDEIVALDRTANEYIAITGSGALLWPLLLAGATEEALAQALVDRFGVGREVAATDVGRFVADLAARGLLEHR